ncbi:seipin-like isoform X1 [Stylophora pistillata]|uniref:Seipin n=1 Tax=Stylophora pistillata TaxID=50429 RepID=A0A2B4SMZ3_STYPI|nr:seipin-like isoform X1 [Stylophora pistillata]PFX30736.1 Seipin [Stylophora pistillata]
MSRWRIVRFTRDVTVGASRLVGVTVVRFLMSCCTVFVILWIAVLLYVSFYYAYMPTVSHVRPVFLLFNSNCDDSRGKTLCSFPEANLSLSTGERILMRGQRYQVFLDLEMPHSPVNEKLGMFMVRVTFLSESGKVLASSERSGMLHYKSALLQSLGTVFYSLPMVLGFTEEKQIVQINLLEEYVEDSYHPAVGATVIVLSKEIEIYSAALRIEAHFVGLRYIMINWPVTSALLSITINFFIISAVFFFAYSAFSPDSGFEEHIAQPQADLDTVTEEQQRTLTRRRVRAGRDRPGTEDIPPASLTRPPRTGRLKPRKLSSSRTQAPSRSNGGMTRCASFPSSRWDWCILQRAPTSAAHKAPRSLHRNSPRHHSNDDLGSRTGCSCPGVIANGDGKYGSQVAYFQNPRSLTNSPVDTEPYYILSFREGRAWRSGRRHGSDGGDGYAVARYGSSVDGYPVVRQRAGDDVYPVLQPGSSGLRLSCTRKKVLEHDALSSGSSTECVHMRRSQKLLGGTSLGKSFDSARRCDHSAYERDFDHGCHDECRDGSDLSINEHLQSRVPDGAASSSEYIHNLASGARSAQDSGLVSSEQSVNRPLNDSEHGELVHKRSVNKTRARFGLSLKRMLSKRDDKSS